MFAKSIHNLSPRKDKPLISVNCGAIPEGILESELFGHEKGSFTGAIDSRKGYFEGADGGTLFLDEIGEMPVSTQVKLLRVLEEKSFMRVGGTKSIQVDVRVIAATNKDLDLAVQRETFRKDLYYRLNAVKIHAPPLRERREDIPLLAESFAEEVCKENNIIFKGFTEEAVALLKDYAWPGNIRELRNIIERIIILEGGRRITDSLLETHMGSESVYDRNLPVLTHKTADQAERELIYRALLDIRMTVEEIRNMIVSSSTGSVSAVDMKTPISSNMPKEVTTYEENEIRPIKDIEKEQIRKALVLFKGNRRRAAQALKIGERTFYRKLKEYGLD
jgi:transcriptional regulator with PAS, ATPase and Fis domain